MRRFQFFDYLKNNRDKGMACKGYGKKGDVKERCELVAARDDIYSCGV